MDGLSSIIRLGREIRLPRQPVRALGIDLGTTNSTVAEILWNPADGEGPRVRCLEVEQPTRQGPYIGALVPSVVAVHEGQVIVGEGARQLRTRAQEYGLERFKNLFWDCKNDIGLRRTYHKAPPGFRSAPEVAARVLRFLSTAAVADDSTSVAQTVVTAPASFRAAQRQDTVHAAELGGLDLSAGGALLDEPVAAFLDYLMGPGAERLKEIDGSATLGVFDFGGGTCDVALFQLQRSTRDQRLEIAPLTVSRYHRLGGGDIDTAIVIDVLLPQLIAQNGLDARTLDFEVKDKFVKPALLGVAESLKIGLCLELARLRRFGRDTEEARAQLVRKNPGTYRCALPDGSAPVLKSPTLSVEEFDRVLEPFLDIDLLYARETDYGLTCSIFAPLADALDRAGLGPEALDLCLMVGGSSLIPHVRDALADYLGNARLLQFDSPELAQTAIARGAAWQALSLALSGRSLIQPVASDRLSLQTQSGAVALIEAGAELPYPSADAWAENRRLVVPETNLHGTLRLRLELRDANGALLASPIWDIKALVNKGDGLRLRYRMDANQVLQMELSLESRPEETIGFTLENPLTHVVSPDAKRERIHELEEQMRTKAVPKAKQRETVEEIALLYAELGQRERALGLLSHLLKSGPDGNILNRMGIICGQIGDVVRQEKLLREAAEVSGSSVPIFNLALSQQRQGLLETAMETIQTAIARDSRPPYLVLKALLHAELGEPAQRDATVQQALERFAPVRVLDDWTLGWYLTGAELAGDGQRQAEAEAERKRRGKAGADAPEVGILVDTRHALVGR